MRKNTSGFTVVELLIVIIVIAILATVTFVAYRGITARARTAQTSSAAEQWLKALQVYRARNGGYPSTAGCLGANYKYNSDGLGASGIGQCRQDTSGVGITDNTTLDTTLGTYITGQPTPAMVSAVNSTTDWRRGAYYYIDSSVSPSVTRIDIVVEGAQTASSCPVLGQYSATTSTTYANGNSICAYQIGLLTGY